MKVSNPKLYMNELKNVNTFRNKDFHKYNSKGIKNPLSFKENTKQNTNYDEGFNYYKNKNKKNGLLYIESIKSTSMPSTKKRTQTNILSEENLITLMNKYINYSLKKSNNKKKNLIRNNIKNFNEENKENRVIDSKKKKCIESLIKKGIITEIKHLQKPKRETLKEKLTQKKKSFLEEIGIEPNNITSFQDNGEESMGNNNNINDIENNNNLTKNNENKNKNKYKSFTGIYSGNKTIKNISPKQKDFDLYLYDEESFSDKECKRTPLKPKINQFEYIRKIKKERSKIQTNPNYISVQPEKATKKIKFMKISSPKIETTLNDSFRHKLEKKSKLINYTSYNINHIKKFNNKINIKIKGKDKYLKNNDNNDEKPHSYKKSCLSPSDLNRYIKNKKLKNKEIKEKKLCKKNKELFLKYKNLCTLNNNNFINCKNKISPNYYNTISIKYKSHISGPGFKEKKKESNKILIGNESFKNNNSTLIDAKEYYLNILESKKLIIKNIYSKTETHFYKNKNNKVEALKNIEDFFNSEKNNKNILIKNNNDKKEIIRKISKKINETLIKAKQIFSLEENSRDINNDDNNKLNNINNNKEPDSNNKDQNIKNENEQKQIIEKINNINNNEIIKDGNYEGISNVNDKKENKNDLQEINYVIGNKENNIECKDNKKTTEEAKENKQIEEYKEDKIIKDKIKENNDNKNEKDNDLIINKKEINIKYNKNKIDTFIKLLNLNLRKKIFMNIYKYYIKISFLEHYYTSISYFIAFFKKYPFIKLREHFYRSKVFLSLKELIGPFIKKDMIAFFNKLKEITTKKVDNAKDINIYIDKEKNHEKTNKENKIKKKLIENELLNNLINENLDDKINSMSESYKNGLNDIITSKEKKVKNEEKDINEIIDRRGKGKQTEEDILAEKDKDKEKILELVNIDDSNKDKNNRPKKPIINKENELENETNIYKNIIINDEEIDKKNIKINEIISFQNNNKNDKSRNGLLLDKEEKNKNNSIDIPNTVLKLNNIDIDSLTEEILNKIISSEISSKEVTLIPIKKFKYEIKLKKSNSNISSNSVNTSADNILRDKEIFGINELSQLSDNLLSLNDSAMSEFSENSIFYKTIIDKKKYNMLHFYQKYIAPKLIELIRNKIIIKYDRIYNNISKPYSNNSDKIMMSLILQDADMLKDNFKCQNNEETISDIIDKEQILKEFEPIEKKIRRHWEIKENKINKKNNKDNKDVNIIYNDYILYDEYLSKCLLECCIELINCERKYGENGNPLIWSSRMREIRFKYEKNNPYKLADHVCKNLYEFIKQKVGLISDNYDFIPSEEINSEREKRLVRIIRNELDEGDYLWKNLEMEETQLKVEVTDNIMDQLYNEIIEILEHIQLNRNKSELYNHKSIYACEDMPKLSFQQTTTENIDLDDNEEENDITNTANV